MNSVTNIAVGLWNESSSFTCVTMLAGEGSFLPRESISVVVTAMKRADGTPLPDTSPIAKQNL